MSRLPTLIRAACGHYVPLDTKPTGQEPNGFQVVLCPACRSILNTQRIEKKA